MRTLARAGDSGDRPAVLVGPERPAAAVLSELRWRPARGLVVVNGGTRDLPEPLARRLAGVFRQGILEVAEKERLDLLTGATDSGIFQALGAALAERPVTRRVVGVAPAGLVAWRRGDGGSAGSAVGLEGHHTDFVLVDGARWGDETPVMLGLAGELGRRAPSVAVLASGGAIARAELSGHVRADRPVIVLEGTGGLAAELAAAHRAGGSDTDPELNEAVHRGHLRFIDAGRDDAGEALAGELRAVVAAARRGGRPRRPAVLRRLPALRWRPPDPHRMVVDLEVQRRYPALARDLAFLNDHLMDAFRTCDSEALRLQRVFHLSNLAAITGSLVATILGVAQAAGVAGRLWVGLAETVLAAVLGGGVLLSAARGAQRRYYDNRLKAERLRAEYFLFLARQQPYAADATRDRALAERVAAIATAGGSPG